eukprot:14326389-Heterocapsa_arctica.AAC.1
MFAIAEAELARVSSEMATSALSSASARASMSVTCAIMILPTFVLMDPACAPEFLSALRTLDCSPL